ncbi:uncharacterized protein LOC126661657 [Mercurialis annua]|uniref:uncharacterized protein LOC126661657 n=1 Tax=Mercurialis annua TaxID=3986 RepID=UPI00215E0A7E|nr:uncharacterized protein LOC126661657 [Mercurialis annua]
MVECASQMKIKLLHSTPYYAQANRQAGATNKAIKLIVLKMIEENPRQWMVYGHDTMLPMELLVMSTRRLHENKLSKGDCFDKMVIEALDMDEERLTAPDHLETQKRRVERACNKWVKSKSFIMGDLVWKSILPIGQKDRQLRKWSPKLGGSLHCDYNIGQWGICFGLFRWRQARQGDQRQFLKKYAYSCWETVDQ